MEGVDRWYGGTPGQGWYAPPASSEADGGSLDEVHVSGTRIELYPEDGVTILLWDEYGSLPEDRTGSNASSA